MKNLIKITILLSLILFSYSNISVYAVLQSNGDAGTTYNLSDWMMNVRKMEELGGAMGLEESINTDLTSQESNKIDVHMQKNTEYGALAILSASSYGNPDKIEDGQTTTGNASGVVMKLNSEWTSAGKATSATNFNNANGRYKNIYENDYVAKRGDAISETQGWHGSTSSVWGGWSNRYGSTNPGIYNAYSGLVRSIDGSIFSYTSRCSSGYYGNLESPCVAACSNQYRSRAVIVQGTDL